MIKNNARVSFKQEGNGKFLHFPHFLAFVEDIKRRTKEVIEYEN
jgi:hypothetical protein